MYSGAKLALACVFLVASTLGCGGSDDASEGPDASASASAKEYPPCGYREELYVYDARDDGSCVAVGRVPAGIITDGTSAEGGTGDAGVTPQPLAVPPPPVACSCEALCASVTKVSSTYATCTMAASRRQIVCRIPLRCPG